MWFHFLCLFFLLFLYVLVLANLFRIYEFVLWIAPIEMGKAFFSRRKIRRNCVQSHWNKLYFFLLFLIEEGKQEIFANRYDAFLLFTKNLLIHEQTSDAGIDETNDTARYPCPYRYSGYHILLLRTHRTHISNHNAQRTGIGKAAHGKCCDCRTPQRNQFGCFQLAQPLIGDEFVDYRFRCNHFGHILTVVVRNAQDVCDGKEYFGENEFEW